MSTVNKLVDIHHRCQMWLIVVLIANFMLE
jgi:hypothetical protein